MTDPARVPAGSRAYRLRGAGAFEAIFRTGRRIDGRYLQLVFTPAAFFPGRIGYVISRKSMSRAVDRNRLRRRLREAIRAARPTICRFDIIVRVKRAMPSAEIPAAVTEGAALIRRLSDAGAA